MGGKVIHNLEQLAEGIGSYIGMMEGLEQQEYLDGLLERVFPEVQQKFNFHAAAMSMRNPEELGHMWEFGTRGITRGTSKYTPTNPNARLWENVLIGRGRNKEIAYTFKPARSQTPPHDPEEIGVPANEIPPLKVMTGARRYYFPNKAYVFETGTDVNVMAKKSKYLFIPTKTEGLPGEYQGDPDKGYVWAKAHTYAPGDFAGSTGIFTAMFASWWLGEGGQLMFDEMAKEVEADLIKTDKTIKASKKMTPAQVANIKAAVKRGERKTRKQFTFMVRQELTSNKKDIVL